MAIERPLDFLNSMKRKRILVQLKEGRRIAGELLAFDIHLNLVLENATEIIGEKEENIEICFIRGDSIIYVA